MALVRCTCVVELVEPDHGRTHAPDVDVRLPDPDCGYVVHRLAAVLPQAG